MSATTSRLIRDWQQGLEWLAVDGNNAARAAGKHQHSGTESMSTMTAASHDDVKRGLVDWLKGQPFNNVLILILIFIIGWLGYYGLTVAWPEHLKTIQAGYERIEASHSERSRADRETFEKTLNIIVDRQAPRQTASASQKP